MNAFQEIYIRGKVEVKIGKNMIGIVEGTIDGKSLLTEKNNAK